MSATYPTSPRLALLQWCQAHDGVWVANAAAIGLTAPQAEAFETAVEAAAAAAVAQEEAKQVAKVATMAAEAAFDTMRTRLNDSLKLIRAFAVNAPDPLTVYGLAQISPPSPPSPAPPPGQPTSLTVLLDANSGTLTLQWKCNNPSNTSGTSYIVKRRLPGESNFTFVGLATGKKFVDDTLLAGPDSVQYTVQGLRSSIPGPISPVFTVSFGRQPDGARTATVSAGSAPSGTYSADKALIDAIVNSKSNTNGRSMVSRS